MRTIAVINQKGGVGKTTTAVNLSAALARAKQRVCLIDLDPQAHATLHLGASADGQRASIYDVLIGRAGLDQALDEVRDGLWLVRSHIDLAAAELELADEVGREVLLRDRIRPDLRGEAQEPFDFVLIDCPPSLGVLTLNALVAVDEVFLPLQPHFLALHGLSRLLETIEVVRRRLNARLRVSGVVMCMYDCSTRLAGEVTQDVQSFLDAVQDPECPWFDARVFRTKIRRNIRLAEAPSFGQSIFEYAAYSKGAEDYRGLAVEVLGDASLQADQPSPVTASSDAGTE